MTYGMTLEIEGYDVQPGIGSITGLDDEEHIKRFLMATIKAADMALAMGPYVYREPERETGKGPGITGMAILVESHVVIHTYPEQRWFLFEICSCKPFRPEQIEKEISEWFRCKMALDCRTIGKHFPES